MEIELRVSDAGLLAELVAPWCGFAPTAPRIDLVHTYEAGEALGGTAPADRPYPAYGARALSPVRYAFSRADSEGEIDASTAPIVARFRGRPAASVLGSTLRLSLATALWRAGGLLLHAAGAVIEGHGVVFAGPSGAGKSTLCRLLRKSGAKILNDEMVAVRPAPDSPTGFVLCATPFGGELRTCTDGRAPLSGVYFLLKAPVHRATRLSAGAALPKLLRNALAYVEEREAAALVLAAGHSLVERVPCHSLEFMKDAGVREALSLA